MPSQIQPNIRKLLCYDLFINSMRIDDAINPHSSLALNQVLEEWNRVNYSSVVCIWTMP